jgi:hypothetical protein
MAIGIIPLARPPRSWLFPQHTRSNVIPYSGNSGDSLSKHFRDEVLRIKTVPNNCQGHGLGSLARTQPSHDGGAIRSRFQPTTSRMTSSRVNRGR